jgi:hypothetical protein
MHPLTSLDVPMEFVAFLNRQKFGSSLLGMIRSGGINRLNPYPARDLIDSLVLDRKQLGKIGAMSFCVGVSSLVAPLHCITQTGEPEILSIC